MNNEDRERSLSAPKPIKHKLRSQSVSGSIIPSMDLKLLQQRKASTPQKSIDVASFLSTPLQLSEIKLREKLFPDNLFNEGQKLKRSSSTFERRPPSVFFDSYMSDSEASIESTPVLRKRKGQLSFINNLSNSLPQTPLLIPDSPLSSPTELTDSVTIADSTDLQRTFDEISISKKFLDEKLTEFIGEVSSDSSFKAHSYPPSKTCNNYFN